MRGSARPRAWCRVAGRAQQLRGALPGYYPLSIGWHSFLVLAIRRPPVRVSRKCPVFGPRSKISCCSNDSQRRPRIRLPTMAAARKRRAGASIRRGIVSRPTVLRLGKTTLCKIAHISPRRPNFSCRWQNAIGQVCTRENLPDSGAGLVLAVERSRRVPSPG